MTDSSNWQERLSEGYPEREEAIAALRVVLLKGLRAGLSGRAKDDDAFLEDVAQVSLLRILDHLDTFEGRSKFSSWALSIAFRVAYNDLRKRKWNAVSLDELKERNHDEDVDQELRPDVKSARNNMATLVREVIASDLTEKQRDVLLCELSGMPQEEIARQLNSSRNAIYKLFHDARKALKRALESRGYGLAEIEDLYADQG